MRNLKRLLVLPCSAALFIVGWLLAYCGEVAMHKRYMQTLPKQLPKSTWENTDAYAVLAYFGGCCSCARPPADCNGCNVSD